MIQKLFPNRSKRIVVAVVGICGAIGSTLALGVARAQSGKLPGSGMVTESAEFKVLLPDDLPPIDDWILTGWDITKENLLQSARRHQCCERYLVELEEKRLANMRSRLALMPEPGWEKRFREESDALLRLKEKNSAEQIIIVNLAPTELVEIQEVDNTDIDWENLKIPASALPKLSISRLYFRLAIEVGAGFINFTPNIAETPVLLELAERRGILYCGRDGKTGETYLKTVLAPAFRNKNFKVDGWFSLNILGNADGFNLQSSSARDTKIKSKQSSLEAILGYVPGKSDYGHQVHIHYYPPRGDSKESWNNVDFSGFLGEPMQLKFNWLGKDSSLAAASVLDLVRFFRLAHQAGEIGLLEPLGYFFKLPLTRRGHLPEHASDRQYQALLDFVRRMGVRLPEHLGGLLRHLTDYQRSRRDCLSMHASENRMTQGTALLLAGDLANRYALKDPGNTPPGDIIFGNSQPMGRIITFCEKSLGSLIGAEYVNLTPISGYVAADCLLYAFCDPGQTVFLVDQVHGGHPEMIPLARQFGLEVRFIPFDSMKPNVRKLQKMVDDAKPALVYFNQSDALVLDGITGLSMTASETVVALDVSHVLGLVAGGLVTSPLNTGYDCLVGSTHKTFPGPHKGFFATRSQDLQNRFIMRTKNKISSSHPHHAAALAFACEEYEVYGTEYARRLVQNAEVLAKAFENEGLSVIRAEETSIIETNQVWLRAADKNQAVQWFRRLEDGGIFTNYRELV